MEQLATAESTWFAAIKGFIIDAFKWLIDWFMELAGGALAWLLALFPTPVAALHTDLVYWLEVANYWVPIGYALTLWASYFTFWGSFQAVKIVRQFFLP